jgi:hypothetical protein
VNYPVYSWAIGNLYSAGIHNANLEWIAAAVAKGEVVKGWVEAEPTVLANETWAMSGGATMWGILGSYFRAHPDETTPWLLTYKDYMDIFSTPGQFTNAWNGWYALGHRSVGEALADAYHLGIHVTLTDTLIAEDGDGDGGIPARPEDNDNMDQTWVTNYLAFMGLDPLLPSAQAVSVLASEWRHDLRAWPNPTPGALSIVWEAPADARTRILILDPAGRAVADLGTGRRLEWDGRDARGRPVPSGVYWAVARGAGIAAARPIRVLRR